MQSKNRNAIYWALYSVLLGLSLKPDLNAQQPSAEKLTLDQAISEALANNLALLAERANIAIAEARMLTARLRPNPVLSLGGDHLDLLGTGLTSSTAPALPSTMCGPIFLLSAGESAKAAWMWPKVPGPSHSCSS